MKRGSRLLFTGVAAIAGLVVVRRWAARRGPMPCPARLSWLLENPYTKRVMGSETLIERLDLSPGMKVLDVGCGPGRLTVPAARRVGRTGEVTALDIQPTMLERARQRVEEADLHNVRFIEAGAGEGALEANTYDRALLVTVLGEIPKREQALTEIFKALKPGGILSVTEMLPDPDYQPRATLERMAHAAGFVIDGYYGSWLAYTLNLARPANGAN